MASILKHKQGWRARINMCGVSKSKVFRTKYAAEQWARKIEDEIDSGTYSDRSASERMTLDNALARYLDTVSSKKKGRGFTCDTSLAGIIRQYPIARLPLAKIKPADVVELRDKFAKTAAANTIRLRLALISHVFTIASKEWGMNYLANPVANIRKPSVARTGRDRRLQGDEETRLLEEAEKYGSQMPAIIRLALETAMRRSEIADLRWDDVDLKRCVVHLEDTKNGESRDVPLSIQAVKVLQSLPRRLDGEVFGMRSDSVGQAFRRIAGRAHIEDLRFHDLRHEATSRLFEKGLDSMEAAFITGHKSLQMLKRYTHLRAENLAKKLG